MKYAFMTFSCPAASLDDVLAMAKAYGYDGIELRVSSRHAHGVELDSDAAVRQAAKRKAAEAGIALCCVATSCKFADPETRQASIDDAHRAIDLAGDLGAPRVRVFGGAVPKGISRADAIAGVSEALASLAGHATERGVVVCMETHDDWCDPAHVAAVLEKVNKPSIAANWDIMHPIRRAGATMDSAFATLKPWIKHIHFHDGLNEGGKGDLKPIGEGAIDHKTAVRLLQSLPYEGFLSGEWINWEPAEQHLPRELATMKGYEAEG
ncbi:MAG: sugar phosphate isomerase/epimerase [Kiritimatiellae bacterium]|nr:sugar phosphate isomerase/epimerase [Kiritimatiellia bacterium]